MATMYVAPVGTWQDAAWAWNTVGTTTTATTITYAGQAAQTATGAFGDWVQKFTGVDPAWIRANETQEDKEERERRQLLQYLEMSARSMLTHAFDMDECVHRARRMSHTRFGEIEHHLPRVLEEHAREVEDAWQRRREEAIARERAAEAQAEQLAAAERRAEALLLSVLSAEQKREWLEHKWVTEVAPSGRTWRLYPKWSGGATIMSETQPKVRRATLCVHGKEAVPLKDNMVMLLMTIRGDEERLIRLGIMHDGMWTEDELAIRRTRQQDVDAAAA